MLTIPVLSHISLYTAVLLFLHSYQLQWRKISYSNKKNSNVKTGISYNEENKLLKVKKRCVSLSLPKWRCSLYTPRTKIFKCSLASITCWLLMPLFPILPLNLIHQLDELTPDHVLILFCIDLHFLDDFYIQQSLYE